MNTHHTHHTLQSESYFTSDFASTKKAKRAEARKAIGDLFFNCFLAILVGVSMFTAIKYMPFWLPVVQTWFHEATNYRHF